MPLVEVRFSALPAHVRTARLVATAVARRTGVDEALLDEVRLAIGEACSRAVDLHRRYAPREPIVLQMSDGDGTFKVTVVDSVAAADEPPAGELGSGDFAPDAIASIPDPRTLDETRPEVDFLPVGFGLAVIAGLVDDVEVAPAASGGTSVRMVWPAGRPDGAML